MIFDYRAEPGWRIGQFRRYLQIMDRRAHEVAHGPCFLVFEYRPPDGTPGAATAGGEAAGADGGEAQEGVTPGCSEGQQGRHQDRREDIAGERDPPEGVDG